MKLRQKLAVTMAAAMLISAVPVVTMADSTNRVVKGNVVLAKDTETEIELSIDFKDNDGTTDEEFFIELTGAKFLDATPDETTTSAAAKATANYTLTKQEDKIAKVVVPATTIAANSKVIISLPVKITDNGQVKAKLTANGGNSTITEGEYVIANASDKAATLTLGDDKTFYDMGELNKITLKETFLGSLAKVNAGKAYVKIELDDTDFEFVRTSSPVAKGKYGFAGADYAGSFTVAGNDPSTAYVELKGLPSNPTSLGVLEITGIKVRNDEKEISLGDLTASISLVQDITSDDNKLDKSYDKQVVAKIADFGAVIEMNDSKAVEIIAGRQEEVKFKVKETIKDSLTQGRKVEVKLDTEDAYFMLDQYVTDASSMVISDGKDKFVDSVEVLWVDEKAARQGDDLRANGFNITLKTGYTDKVEIEVKSNVYVPVSAKDKTEVKLTLESRGVDKVTPVSAVTIKKPFDFKFEQTTLKVGLQGQTINDFTITETDKQMFTKGDIRFELVKNNKTVAPLSIDEIGTIEVTGDLKKTDFNDRTTGNGAKVELARQSKSASSITVKGMKVTADRMVPEGTYDLRISGTAIDNHTNVGDDNVNTILVKDFIKIGTQNTEDMAAANGLAKTDATFTIGSTTYVVNGVEKTMDATPYVQDPGYTMIPVRYVADALGVKGTDILANGGIVTIFAGNRTVQLTNGSNVAVVNGAQISMATKVVIKEGRTYVPVAEIGRILGVAASWDNETKTATFKN